ncbi:MAG: glycoside hydrolase domain-containing protein [Planctomycetota bacterium]
MSNNDRGHVSAAARNASRLWLVAVCAVLFCLAPLARCAAGTAAGPEILRTDSYWRYYIAWKTEMVREASGEMKVLDAKPGQEAEVRNSAPPPANWATTEFDDSSWARTRGPLPAASGEMSLICLRGRFRVDNPPAAGNLKLALEVLGGAVVYVNGKEIARQGMPDGETKLDTPAVDYPEKAYLDPDGFLYRNSWGDPAKYKDRLRCRVRELRDLAVPASALRKGVNVLAVEIHRAPVSPLLLTKKTRDAAREAWRGRGHYWWSRLGFRSLSLTGGGAAPNVSRPAGLKVWNHPVPQRVRVVDYGDPNEPLRPVTLSGARRSVLSGQVVVSSSAPIRGLRVSASDLRASGVEGSIPAAAVAVSFPLPDGPRGRRNPICFETLSPKAPTEVAVEPSGKGAVQPVWISVRVPEKAGPGTYSGKLTISAAGAAAVEVPISLKVHDWLMPEPRDFVSHVGLVQSPETVAEHYKVEMWSDRHWKLIEKSFQMMGELGSDVVFLPLIRRTHFGNEHSMVRWVRNGKGYKHDFSLVEKYLDTAIRHLGKPEVVCLYCWEPFTGSNYFGKPGKTSRGMPFTILDPATGKLEEAEGPKWGTPEVREFWKPVMDGMREILRKRGLEKAMMVGTAGDSRPNKNAVEDLKAVAPNADWVLHSHGYAEALFGSRVGHMCDVWNSPVAPDPSKKRLYGWKNPFIRATFPRAGSRTMESIRIGSPPAQYMLSLEGMQAAGIRGFGRMGADFWSLRPRNSKGRGRAYNMLGRYPESGWAQLNLENSATYVLTPGPEGALPTVRFEMIRAAAQTVEARVFLERLLLDAGGRGKLGEERAARIQKLLDERTRVTLYARKRGWKWFLSSGWQARDDALFAAAAEAAKATAGK